jgi:hypothetical protein
MGAGMSGFIVTLILGLLGSCQDRAQKPHAETAPTPATRTVRVQLVDLEGKPIGSDGVGIWWAKPGAEFGTSVGMLENGQAVLENVPAGPIVLCALPDGFVVPSKGWARKVVPNGVTETTLVLSTGVKRTLRVLGWNQGSLGLAYLAAVGDTEPSHHGVNEDGIICLEGLRPGVKYNLFIREDEGDRSALLRGLPADAPWPMIELAPGRDVTGRVILPEGCTYAVVAILVDKAVMIDGGVVRSDGAFRIRAVPDGTWTVVTYTTFKEKYRATTANVRAGGKVTLDLTMPTRK